MNVRDFECRSYRQAMELLRGNDQYADRDRRTVCNNTTIEDYSGLRWGVRTFAVRLHNHIIIRFSEDGEVVVDSCGYRTATTKDRINRCLPKPWRVCQTKGGWVLWKRNDVDLIEEVLFVDGMTVPETGDEQ